MGDGGKTEARGEAALPPVALPARGILITHGALGEELRRTAELIVGHAGGLDAVSNTGLSTAALAGRLEALLAGDPPERPLFLFVDLLGGSCAGASTELLRTRRARLFTGVNLPMVIAFIQCRETMGEEELVAGILMRAHRGIAVLPASPAAAGAAAGPGGAGARA